MLWVYFFLGIAVFIFFFWLTEQVEHWEKWN